VGNYVVHVDLLRNRRSGALAASLGFAIVISTASDEYFISGRNVQVTFSPNTPGPEIAGIADAETGRFVKGEWIPGRKMNGDDILLDYNQTEAAANNQSGSGLMFGADGPTVQRVKLYRYQ
jgi:hypothetical protein